MQSMMEENLNVRENCFAIFHFSIDNSAEIVPWKWLSPCGLFCWYPHAGSQTKVSRAVKAATPRNEDFTNYAGRILGTFDTYEEAKTKLPLALTTSDLEDEPRMKSSNRQHKLPVPPNKQSSPSLGLVSSNSLESSSDKVNDQLNTTVPTTQSPMLFHSVSVADSVVPTSEIPLYSQHSSSVCPILLDNNGVISAVYSGQNSDFQKDVLAKLTEIEVEQKAQRELLNNILDHVTSTQPSKKPTHQFEAVYFPLKTMQDLQAFDHLLRDNSLAFDAMVFQMTRDGRGTTEGALKSILKGLCVDDVVALHNYRGQSEKPSLLSYAAVIGCLTDSLKNNCRITDYSRETFDKAMQLVLKQTSDRVRERRKASVARSTNSEASRPEKRRRTNVDDTTG